MKIVKYSYDYDFLGQFVGANYENQSQADETYSYDAEGNRISKTNSTNRELYTWDHRNRLTSVTQQEFDAETETWQTVQIVEYTYDFNNVWIRKIVGNSKTIFIPENYQTVAQIDDATLSHIYLWTPNAQDKLLADVTPTATLWSLTDHLGMIRDVLSPSETTHLTYDAFGNLTSSTANPLLFGYTGKPFDASTQFQNNINRWYDPTVGRWLSTDPIGFQGNDTNLYRYALNNTAVYSDNDGKKCGSCIPSEIYPDAKYSVTVRGIWFSSANPNHIIALNIAKDSAELLAALQTISSPVVSGVGASTGGVGKVIAETTVEGIHQTPSIPSVTAPNFQQNPNIQIRSLKNLEKYLSNATGFYIWVLMEYQTCEACCPSFRGYDRVTHSEYYKSSHLWTKDKFPSQENIEAAIREAIKTYKINKKRKNK